MESVAAFIVPRGSLPVLPSDDCDDDEKWTPSRRCKCEYATDAEEDVMGARNEHVLIGLRPDGGVDGLKARRNTRIGVIIVHAELWPAQAGGRRRMIGRKG